jgi:SAM-dependent methyltransferase
MQHIQEPVLVAGAGQGLIVGELRRRGFQCEGVDLSSEMIKYAKLRRGLTLIHADARAMPFPERTYRTIIYATGVVDFIGDEEQIKAILNEGRRILHDSGKIFVAFYRLSAAMEDFLKRVGLLSGHVLAHRRSLQTYLLSPAQMMAWVRKSAGVGYVRAFALLLRVSALSRIQEKTMSLRMRTILRKMEDPNSWINAAPNHQPYRNEAEIRNLFVRLAIPLKQFYVSPSCFIVHIQ